MNSEEALAYAIQLLKEGKAKKYGYDYFAASVARRVATLETKDKDPREIERKTAEYHNLFAEAGWVLSLRGILRPGVNELRGQALPEGGYTFTDAGKAKVDQLDDATVLLFQSSSLISTFEGFEDRFGAGFVQRATEAVHCRDAGLWYSACAMCGAAAEAVLLETAVAKNGDREAVLRAYRASGGRSKILNLITGTASAYLKMTLKDFSGIIGSWRDDAGHGAAVNISEANAAEALRQLLHMCQWIQKEWDNLTA